MHVEYPSAQNSHRYEDAHARLYGTLIDGLSRTCIERLAKRVGRPINVQSERTVAALTKLLPVLRDNKDFSEAFSLVSDLRRRAAHHERTPATPMTAFEHFEHDLSACVSALVVLRQALENELRMDAKHSLNRQEALKGMPKLEPLHVPSDFLERLQQMKGRTVAAIEVGQDENLEGVHRGEAIGDDSEAGASYPQRRQRAEHLRSGVAVLGVFVPEARDQLLHLHRIEAEGRSHPRIHLALVPMAVVIEIHHHPTKLCRSLSGDEGGERRHLPFHNPLYRRITVEEGAVEIEEDGLPG